MSEKDELVELYTSKLEMNGSLKTARFSVVVSAMRGTIEDVNEGMNEIAKTFRIFFKDKV